MVPQEELPILEALVNIKHRLTVLKKDTSTFIRARDVLQIYHNVAKEVTKLNAVRERRDDAGSLSKAPSSSNAGLNIPVDEEGEGPGSKGKRRASSFTLVDGQIPPPIGQGGDGLGTSPNVTLPQEMAWSSGSFVPGESSAASTSSSSSDGFSASEGDEDTEDTEVPPTQIAAQPSPNPDGSDPLSSAAAKLSIALDDTPKPTLLRSPSSATLRAAQVPSRSASRSASPEPDLADISQRDIPTPKESNRVDMVLNDVFSLLSLFFLTIGKSRESVGVYCQIASMRQLLDHMNESGVYTQQDLQPFSTRLQVLKGIVKSDREEGKVPDGIMKLMLRKLEDTERMFQTLLKSLSVLSVELVPIHQRLVHIRRQLASLATQFPIPKSSIRPLVIELREIDSSRVDGKFLGPGGSSVPTGQAILVGLLEENFEIVQEIRAREGEGSVGGVLRPIWERLTEMRAKLERLQLTHRWTLRETDLYNYSQALREVDAMRVDGAFVDADGNRAEGQYVLLYLLRKCYGLIYRLIAESEPISEELMPIANKLSTVKKCLNEVLKYGGPFSARDLYPYHLALHQIDSLRKDGKFLSDDGSIPEGQAILVAQLSEAHEILEMLKDSMGDDDDDEEEDEDEEEVTSE